MALKRDGTVVAWGYNYHGQTNVPAGLTGVTAIAAGSSHTVALRYDGTVVAWGNNYGGQTNVPAGLTGVTAIAAGRNHTVALVAATQQAHPQVLRILTQPSRQTVQSGNSVGFTVTAIGLPPLDYQWLKNGVILAGATSPTLTLKSVTAAASGGYSVTVRNASGSIVSDTAHLAVLTDGANDTKPGQIVAPIPPVRPTGVDSLVLVTHGWEPFQQRANIGWIDDMAGAIKAKVPGNWKAEPFHWELWAALPLPDLAVDAGLVVGTLYARQHLVPQHWKHVHFIGHSAGSAVIEAMARELKSAPNPPDVHLTFLDPYTKTTLKGRDAYGVGADWAENYFSKDLLSNVYTEGPLLHAHNVEVTWLDEEHITYVTNYCPFGMAETTPATILDRQSPCSVQGYVSSSHGWPYKFYQATIAGDVANALGYGFSRSKEGGGWDSRKQYPTNNSPVVLNGQAALLRKLPPSQTQGVFQFGSLPTSTSLFGASFSGAGGFNLSSGRLLPSPQSGARPTGARPLNETGEAPAWLAVGVPVTNAVNFVQFDASFAGTSATEGLLTVYWNTNQVGMVDERVAAAGLQTYRFALPAAETNGLFTLSFRLDAFHQTASSVTVTNVATGFVGVTQPITLEATGLATNGAPVLKLTGASDYTYLIQASTNLLDWTPTALLVNTNGTVLFADPGPTSKTTRFYRATLP